MAARNKPAGIRSLVYGVGKGKGGIESLSVSACLNRRVCVPIYRYQARLNQAEHDGLFGRFLTVAN
jgi:hypothetical protein